MGIYLTQHIGLASSVQQLGPLFIGCRKLGIHFLQQRHHGAPVRVIGLSDVDFVGLRQGQTQHSWQVNPRVSYTHVHTYIHTINQFSQQGGSRKKRNKLPPER
jgi:hypothetical protein